MTKGYPSFTNKGRVVASGSWLGRSEVRDFHQTRVYHQDDLPRLQNMANGVKTANIFSRQEYADRLVTLRRYMAENDLSGVVLTSYHNINYYSGFLFCHFGRFYALVVTPHDCVTVSAGIDGGQPWRRSDNEGTVTYTDWHRDNYFYAIQQELKGAEGKIGFEFDNVTLDNYAKFNDALPANEKVDIGKATMRMRLKKSEEERVVIRHGARIADLGGEAGVEAIEDGAPEYEVALHATRAMVREIAKTYPQSDIMDTWTWFASGINTDGGHNPATTRKVQKGDILSLNTFPMIQGYYTALERTVFLDHASDAHLRNWEINCEVHRRGIELIKPGARCCDIAKELNQIYREADLLKYRSFGYGHSFGTLCHYYGREAELELREDIETVLEPGMVVSMEPMIMIPETEPGAGGYREHDILIVTDDGNEDITKFPYGPEHNIIQK